MSGYTHRLFTAFCDAVTVLRISFVLFILSAASAVSVGAPLIDRHGKAAGILIWTALIAMPAMARRLHCQNVIPLAVVRCIDVVWMACAVGTAKSAAAEPF